MSIFLSKKWKLALEKQEAAEAVRRQISDAKAMKAEEMKRIRDDKKAALQRYQEVEDELGKEVEKQRLRLQSRTTERRGSRRILKVGSRQLVMFDTKDGYSSSPRPHHSKACCIGLTPPPCNLSDNEFQYPRDLDSITQRDPKSSLDYDEIALATPQTSTKHPRLRLRNKRGKSEQDRLPPPTIPYPTTSGDVLSVHILKPRHSLVKRSLDLRCLSEECAGHKAALDSKSPNGHHAKQTSEPPESPFDRAQFHVFRDVPMSEYCSHRVKIDYGQRYATQKRMKDYALMAKKEHPPVPDERKRLELVLLRERREECHLRKKFQRVGLFDLGKS